MSRPTAFLISIYVVPPDFSRKKQEISGRIKGVRGAVEKREIASSLRSF